MSSFTAVNFSEDESDIEEHTRELQIEEGFKIYDRALHFQRAKNYQAASHQYKILFDLDIVKDEIINVSPAIENIRFLALRNRGMLRLHQLLEESVEQTTPEHVSETLNICIQDLVQSLLYSEGDPTLMSALRQLFLALGHVRPARLGFEYEILKNDSLNASDDSYSIMRNIHGHVTYLMPQTRNLLCEYHKFLENRNELQGSLSNEFGFWSRNKLSPPQSGTIDTTIKDKIESLIRPLPALAASSFVIDVSKEEKVGFSSKSIFASLQSVLPKQKTKTKKDDPYYLCSEILENVKFNVIDEVPPVELDEKVEPVEPAEVEIVEIPEDNSEKQPDEDNLNRASKRTNRSFRQDGLTELHKDDLSDQDRFFSALNYFLSLVPGDIVLKSVVEQFVDPNVPNKDQHISDIVQLLDNWSQQYTEMLLLNVESNDKYHVSVMDILNTSTVSEFGADLKSIQDYESSDQGQAEIRKLVETVDNQTLHYIQVRILLLEYILTTNPQGTCLITDYKIEKETLDVIKDYLDYSEDELLARLKNSVTDAFAGRGNTLSKQLSIGISTMDVLVDRYIGVSQELKTKKNLEKNKHLRADFETSLASYNLRIEKWQAAITDGLFVLKDASHWLLSVRYRWSLTTFQQHNQSLSIDSAKEKLSELVGELLRHPETDVLNINFEYIPRLNAQNSEVQLSKTNVLTTFAKILNDSDNLEDTNRKISILEKILMPSYSGSQELTNKQHEMEEFIKSSNVELTLKLWQILLKYYLFADNYAGYQQGFEIVLNILVSELRKTSESTTERWQSLVRILAFYGEFSNNFIAILSKRKWDFSSRVSSQTMPILCEFLRVCYVFLLHTDISKMGPALKKPIQSQSYKVYERLRDMLLNTFSLFYLYYTQALGERKPEILNDLISVIHEHTGTRGWCEAAGGTFLRLIEDSLLKMGWIESDKDIFQVIHCMYHISVSIENFSPFNHKTTKASLTRRPAMKLARYVYPYCFKKKNPLVQTPGKDLKNLLDTLYDIIREPLETIDELKGNTSAMEIYLQKPITLRHMRDCLYGAFSLGILPFDHPIQEIKSLGVFYLQGVMALQLFKVRKRTMQGRSSELDFVIRALEADIMCCSNRVESWILLGQTYGFLVEDDLVWTSDKLNSPERKLGIASNQRKSLLCYLMGINLLSQNGKAEDLSSNMLWSSFSKELYNAAMSPMSMLTFPQSDNMTSIIPKLPIYKVLLSSLKVAVQKNPTDWYYFYYLSKIQAKLHMEPRESIETLLRSCAEAVKGNASDPVVEPHHRLCWSIFKFVQKGRLTVQQGLEYLKRDPVSCPNTPTEAASLEDFAKIIIECLNEVSRYDKRNWHHRPVFKRALLQHRILYNYNEARTTMSGLINLKPTVRNLVTIWKPAAERPGKHFQYSFQYASFFRDLLIEQRDLISLLHFAKKLRKFGSNMVDMLGCWEITVFHICKFSRRYFETDEKFTETVISEFKYADFAADSRRFLTWMEIRQKEDKVSGEELKSFYLFSELSDLRKMANGFSGTSNVDDTFYGIYLKMFVNFKRLNPEVPVNEEEKPPLKQTQKSRIARKDILTFCNSTLGIFSKGIDELKKKANESGEVKIEIPDAPVENQEPIEIPDGQPVLETPKIVPVTVDDTPEKSGVDENQTSEPSKVSQQHQKEAQPWDNSFQSSFTKQQSSFSLFPIIRGGSTDPAGVLKEGNSEDDYIFDEQVQKRRKLSTKEAKDRRHAREQADKALDEDALKQQ